MKKNDIAFVLAPWLIVGTIAIVVALLVHFLGVVGSVASLIILAALAFNAYGSLQEVLFAIPTRLGRRLKRVIYEGPFFLFPLIDKVKEENIFSLKPFILPIHFNFFSADNRELILQAKLRVEPDPSIKTKKGFVRFLEVTSEMIAEGLNSKVESEIGRLGGLHPWPVFIGKRRPIEHYINCILRMSKPPHTNPKGVLREYLNSYSELEAKAISSEVPLEERLGVSTDVKGFYQEFSGPIGDMLRMEHENPKDHSEVEIFYGLDLLEFTVDIVDFSPETKVAMEKEKRTDDLLKAARLVQKQKMEMAMELKSLDVDPQSALDSAELNLDQAKKEINSIVGLKGLNISIGGK